MVNNGDDKGLPLSTLGMLGCDLNSCRPQNLPNDRKGGDGEARRRFEEESEEGQEGGAG